MDLFSWVFLIYMQVLSYNSCKRQNTDDAGKANISELDSILKYFLLFPALTKYPILFSSCLTFYLFHSDTRHSLNPHISSTSLQMIQRSYTKTALKSCLTLFHHTISSQDTVWVLYHNVLSVFPLQSASRLLLKWDVTLEWDVILEWVIYHSNIFMSMIKI